MHSNFNKGPIGIIHLRSGGTGIFSKRRSSSLKFVFFSFWETKKYSRIGGDKNRRYLATPPMVLSSMQKRERQGIFSKRRYLSEAKGHQTGFSTLACLLKQDKLRELNKMKLRVKTNAFSATDLVSNFVDNNSNARMFKTQNFQLITFLKNYKFFKSTNKKTKLEKLGNIDRRSLFPSAPFGGSFFYKKNRKTNFSEDELPNVLDFTNFQGYADCRATAMRSAKQILERKRKERNSNFFSTQMDLSSCKTEKEQIIYAKTLNEHTFATRQKALLSLFYAKGGGFLGRGTKATAEFGSGSVYTHLTPFLASPLVGRMAAQRVVSLVDQAENKNFLISLKALNQSYLAYWLLPLFGIIFTNSSFSHEKHLSLGSQTFWNNSAAVAVNNMNKSNLLDLIKFTNGEDGYFRSIIPTLRTGEARLERSERTTKRNLNLQSQNLKNAQSYSTLQILKNLPKRVLEHRQKTVSNFWPDFTSINTGSLTVQGIQSLKTVPINSEVLLQKNVNFLLKNPATWDISQHKRSVILLKSKFTKPRNPKHNTKMSTFGLISLLEKNYLQSTYLSASEKASFTTSATHQIKFKKYQENLLTKSYIQYKLNESSKELIDRKMSFLPQQEKENSPNELQASVNNSTNQFLKVKQANYSNSDILIFSNQISTPSKRNKVKWSVNKNLDKAGKFDAYLKRLNQQSSDLSSRYSIKFSFSFAHNSTAVGDLNSLVSKSTVSPVFPKALLTHAKETEFSLQNNPFASLKSGFASPLLSNNNPKRRHGSNTLAPALKESSRTEASFSLFCKQKSTREEGLEKDLPRSYLENSNNINYSRYFTFLKDNIRELHKDILDHKRKSFSLNSKRNHSQLYKTPSGANLLEHKKMFTHAHALRNNQERNSETYQQDDFMARNILSSRLAAQKKRKAKKLRLETRRQKKRTRLYPRPQWVRMKLLAFFLKSSSLKFPASRVLFCKQKREDLRSNNKINFKIQKLADLRTSGASLPGNVVKLKKSNVNYVLLKKPKQNTAPQNEKINNATLFRDFWVSVYKLTALNPLNDLLFAQSLPRITKPKFTRTFPTSVVSTKELTNSETNNGARKPNTESPNFRIKDLSFFGNKKLRSKHGRLVRTEKVLSSTKKNTLSSVKMASVLKNRSDSIPLYWALHKTNNSYSFTLENKRFSLWTKQKIRQQAKNNKTVFISKQFSNYWDRAFLNKNFNLFNQKILAKMQNSVKKANYLNNFSKFTTNLKISTAKASGKSNLLQSNYWWSNLNLNSNEFKFNNDPKSSLLKSTCEEGYFRSIHLFKPIIPEANNTKQFIFMGAAFLFHSCALITLISISQLRCFIKFHLILIYKFSNVYTLLISKFSQNAFFKNLALDTKQQKRYWQTTKLTSKAFSLPIATVDKSSKYLAPSVQKKAIYVSLRLLNVFTNRERYNETTRSTKFKLKSSKKVDTTKLNLFTKTQIRGKNEIGTVSNLKLNRTKVGSISRTFDNLGTISSADVSKVLYANNVNNVAFGNSFLYQVTRVSQSNRMKALISLHFLQRKKAFFKNIFNLIDSSQLVLKGVTSFFQNPGEITTTWIAYSFLLEWSSDLLALLPETIDIYLWNTFSKIARITYVSSTIFNSAGFVPVISGVKPLFNFKTSVLDNVTFTALAFLIQRRVDYLFNFLIKKIYEPDTDLIRRQQKGTLFWDIWADYVVTAAEEYNVNIAALSTIKAEQNNLIDKICNTSVFRQRKSNYEVGFSKIKTNSASQSKRTGEARLERSESNKLTFKHLVSSKADSTKKEISGQVDSNNKTGRIVNYWQKQEAQKNLRSLDFSVTYSRNEESTSFKSWFTNYLDSSLELKSKANLNDRWAVNQFITYQSWRNTNDLFIDYHPPKGFLHLPSIKHNSTLQQPIGTLVCQIYSGLFTKQISKNILLVNNHNDFKPDLSSASQGSLISSETAVIDAFKIKFDNATSSSLKFGDLRSGKLQPKQPEEHKFSITTKNQTKKENTQNYNVLLIQALAGETELKIITDSAKRYAIVNRGFAIGIKLLRDVFDKIKLTTPCIFLLEDIHAIGERRPMLISDYAGEDMTSNNDLFMSHRDEIHEKNQVVYQNFFHAITHYRKPFKGDYSTAIPTNKYLTDLYRFLGVQQTNNLSLTSGENLTLKPKIKTTDAKDGAGETKKARPISFPLYPLYNKGLRSNLKTLIKSENLSPPSNSPFSILFSKETTKDLSTKPVQEYPWTGLTSEQLVTKPRISYSVRAKVAMLAELSLSNLSGKLDMITDLLVIIDSVRGNKGFVVFATTDMPQMLDPALRRPGRLDETICMPSLEQNSILTANSNYEIFRSVSFRQASSFVDFSSFRTNRNVLSTQSKNTAFSNNNFTLSSLTYGNFRSSNLLTINLNNCFLNLNVPLTFSLLSKSKYCYQRYLLKQKKPNRLRSSSFFTDIFADPRQSKSTKLTKGAVLPNTLSFTQENKGLAKPDLSNAKGLKVQKSKPSGKIAYKDAKMLIYKLLTSTVAKTLINYRVNQINAENKTNISDAGVPTSYSFTLNNSAQINYLSMFGDYIHLSQQIMQLFAGKISTTLISTEFSKISASKNPCQALKKRTLQSEWKSQEELIVSYTQEIQIATNLMLAFIQKRYLYSKNLIVPKLLNFLDGQVFDEPPSPPFSNVLIPAKRFENYKRVFRDSIFLGNFKDGPYATRKSVDISEKVAYSLQLASIKKLKKATFSSSVTSFGFNNSISQREMQKLYRLPSLQTSTNIDWYYQNRVLKRHSQYLINQWWNGQLSEHNAETVFLSDIDWRSTYTRSSRKGRYARNEEDVFLDFPDAEQYYNPRRRRWLITQGYWDSWFNFDKQYTEKFISNLLLDSLTNTYSYLHKNGELIDYLSTKFVTQGFGNFLAADDFSEAGLSNVRSNEPLNSNNYSIIYKESSHDKSLKEFQITNGINRF